MHIPAYSKWAYFMCLSVAAFAQSPNVNWMYGNTGGGPALVAYTPDGQRFVTQFSYGGLKVWRVSDGAVLRTVMAFNNSTTPGYQLGMSADGTKVALCGLDTDGGKMKIVSLTDGSTLLTIPGSCSGASFSPDGSLVSVVFGNFGNVYNSTTGSLVWQIQQCNPNCLPRTDVALMEFAPDGKLGVASKDGGFRIYTVGDNTSYLDYSRYGNINLFTSGVSYSGDYIALFNGAAVYLMERSKGCPSPQICPAIGFRFTDPQMTYPVFSADGTKLATGGLKLINQQNVNYMRTWRTSDFSLIAEQQPETGGTSGVYYAFSPDGQTLATSTARLMLWNAGDLTFQRELSDGASPSLADTLIYSPDGQTVIRGNNVAPSSPPGTNLFVRRTADGSLVSAFNITPDITGSAINALAVSPDGQMIAAGITGNGGNFGTRIIRASDGLLQRSIDTRCTQQIAFLPDGTLAAADGCAAERLGVVNIFRVSDGALLRTIGSTFPFVTGYAFGLTADGQTMVTTNNYGTTLWRVSDGSVIRMSGEGGERPAISPDGQFVAIATDVTVRLYRASDLTLLHTLNGHTLRVSALRFAPDNRYLAVTGSDGVINFWRVSDGALVQSYRSGETGNLIAPVSLRYSPDGRTFLYGRRDGVAVLAMNPYAQPSVTAVTIPSPWPLGGTSFTATVTLNTVAPPGGSVVTLTSSNSAAASVPSAVTVTEGQSTVSFSISTATVTTSAPVTITATAFGPSQSVALTVVPRPAVAGVTLAQPSVAGGMSIRGNRVSLANPAPAGGAVVRLASSRPGVATVPATVVVAAGNTISAGFTIDTVSVSSTVNLNITATLNGGGSATAALSVTPATLTQLTLVPATVRGGTTTSGHTLTLNGPAPAGGLLITLSSANPAVASVPASVTIPAGSQTATFSVTTGTVTSATAVVITASQGAAVTKTATLTVTR